MAAIRERWEQRWTLVLVGLAAAGGLAPAWFLPRLMAEHGGAAFVLAWLAMCLVLGLPLLWYELALGVVLQGAMPDALRRSERRWEWLGWWATALVLVLALISVATASILGQHVLRAGLALISGDGGTIASPSDPALASPQLSGPGLLAGIGMALLAGWLGGAGPARLGRVLHRCLGLAVGALALAFIIGVASPAGTAGLVHGLDPDWYVLLETRTWLAASGMACFTLLAGCGIYTASGSQRPRTSDVGGSALLILVAVVAVQLLASAALLTLSGRAALVAGQLAPSFDALVPALLVDPLAAVDPESPWVGAITVLILASGLGGLLVLGAGVLVHVLVTAWCDRTGDERPTVARRLTWWLAVASVLLASPQGAWWLAAGSQATITWGLLPLMAVLSWAAVWHVGIDGLQDHTSAYSTVRPTSLGSSWLGVLAPVLLTAMWWGRLLEHFTTEAGALGWWLELPVSLALAVIPVVALLCGRIGRGEGEVPPRRIAILGGIAATSAVLCVILVGIATADRRSTGHDLRWLASRWLTDRSWDGPSGERHPLGVARRAWAQGQIDIAEGAIELWTDRSDATHGGDAAMLLAADLSEEAITLLAGDDRAQVGRVLDDLRLLRALHAEGAVERVAAAWRVADWVEDDAPDLLHAAADALRAGDDGADGLRRTAQRWRGLIPPAADVPLVAWEQAPDPSGAAARAAASALRAQAAELATREDLSPDERALAAAVFGEAGVWRHLPSEQRRRLAGDQLATVRPLPAIGYGGGILFVLLAIMALVLRRMGSGPRPIDPSADTLEHVDPIDIDSQAVTLEGEYTTDDSTTSSDSRPIPLA